ASTSSVSTFDFELVRARFALGRRNLNLEDAVLEFGGRGFGFDAFRQRNRTVEAAVAAFALVIAAFFLGTLLSALTLDRHGVLGDFHVQIVFLDAWKIGGNANLAILFRHFDARRPRSHHRLPTALPEIGREEAATHAEVLEHTIDIFA